MAEEAEGASGTEPAVETAEAPIPDNVQATTVAEAAEAATAQAESSDEASSESYTVKVNGEEQEVSLEDLQKGYMLQADYTQKTQGIAETQRRAETLDRFESRLDADPLQTLKDLAAAYDLDLGTTADTPTVEADDSPDDIGGEESALEKQVRELQAWKAEAEKAQVSDAEAKAMAQVDADLEAVKVDNEDPDLDENAVLELAINEGITNMQAAYLLYRSENPKEEAASPPPKVEGGHTTAAPVAGSDKKMSLEEAFKLAEKAQVA